MRYLQSVATVSTLPLIYQYKTHDLCYEITVPVNMRFLNVRAVSSVLCAAAYK